MLALNWLSLRPPKNLTPLPIDRETTTAVSLLVTFAEVFVKIPSVYVTSAKYGLLVVIPILVPF